MQQEHQLCRPCQDFSLQLEERNILEVSKDDYQVSFAGSYETTFPS